MKTSMRPDVFVRLLRGGLLLTLLLPVLAAGCETTSSEVGYHAAVSPQVGVPWTEAFRRPCILVADEIYLEGPEDLLSHVAIVQDPANVDYVMKTTEEGIRQVLTAKPDRARIDVRAQLDGWQLVALKRLVVLQRVREVPVLLRADGEVWWSVVNGGEERRSARLEFEGVRGR